MKKSIPLAVGLLLVFPAIASAATLIAGQGDSTPVSDGPSTNAVNLYLVVLGGLVPLVGYIMNHFLPYTTTQVKGIVQAALAAGVAVLYQAASGSDLGLNDQTLLACVTAMVSAVLAHVGYASSNLNTFFGGGSNASGEPDRVAPGLAGKGRGQ